ncbi:MAG: hypothetical protein WC635_13270 [Bacteriovorax sp.]
MTENKCNEQASGETDISKAIRQLYFTAKQNDPQSFYFINSRFYNYENPLILSMESLERSYADLTKTPVMSQNAEELTYLFFGSRRFEDLKCSFKNLIQKKKYDIRPFLDVAHTCSKKNGNEVCDEMQLLKISSELESWSGDHALGLCRSFSKEASCRIEFNNHRRKKTVGTMLQHYYDRFQTERFEALFKLRPSHQKYLCRKLDEKIVMTVEVLEGSFDHDLMTELLSYVETAWSRKDFTLKLELVKNYNEKVVAIIPTDKGISYVPEENNRMVYLSAMNDRETMKRVLAHEFGHVLGFPDCYIEFFDDSKKELVYYEIAKNNTNIMCSLKTGVSVPDDYYTQLIQKSCLFN